MGTAALGVLRARVEGATGYERGRGAQALAKQHTFQENENRSNWGFDDLTYISTVEMYVKFYP